MTDDLTPLKLDLVEWVAKTPRPYQDVMDVWRTSCPRLPVWEDCVDEGLLSRRRGRGRGDMVGVTGKGHAFLSDHGRTPITSAAPRAGRPKTRLSRAGMAAADIYEEDPREDSSTPLRGSISVATGEVRGTTWKSP